MARGRKRFIGLLVLLLIALLLMTYIRDGRSSFFHKALSSPYDLLNRFTSNIKTNVRDAWNTYEENKTLRRDFERALLEIQQHSEIIEENKRLKELLSLKGVRRDYVATASVVGRGYDRLLHTLIIDKGSKNGVKKDMVVITPKGLVGKIYSVRDEFADVLLLKDPNFSAAVRMQDSRHEGILSGTGYRHCVIKYLHPETNLEKGEIVITSGLDGIFPPGLPVASVSNVQKESVEFFQYVEALPFQADSNLEEVVIIHRAKDER